MRKFQTMWQYMADPSRYVPEDSGENIVQPDLELTPKEIMERWVRNEPLDNMLRNGSFMVEGSPDDDLDDSVFDTQDVDLLDMVDAEEYLATRNHAYTPAPVDPPAEAQADAADAAAQPAEPASQQQGSAEADG